MMDVRNKAIQNEKIIGIFHCIKSKHKYMQKQEEINYSLSDVRLHDIMQIVKTE